MNRIDEAVARLRAKCDKSPFSGTLMLVEDVVAILDDRDALRDGARIAWGSVTWTVKPTPRGYCSNVPTRIVNDDTGDIIDLGTCASLPAAGWRVLKSDHD